MHKGHKAAYICVCSVSVWQAVCWKAWKQTCTISGNQGSCFISPSSRSTCCLDYNLREKRIITTTTTSFELFDKKQQYDTSLKRAIHLLADCPERKHWNQQTLRDICHQDGDRLIFNSKNWIGRFAGLSETGTVGFWFIGWSWRIQWLWWVVWLEWSSCCTPCVCVCHSGWWGRMECVKASSLSVTLMKASPVALHFQPGWVSVSCVISFYFLDILDNRHP